MQSLPLDLSPYQLLVASLSLILTGIGLVRGIERDKYKDILEQLDDAQDRKQWIEQLSKDTPIHLRYSLSLRRLNSYISKLYSTPASLQALERSLIFTLIYPFLLYVVAWIFGGSNKYGNLIYFGSQATGFERLFAAASLISTVALAAATIRHIPDSENLFIYAKTGVFKHYRWREWLRLLACIVVFVFLWTVNQSLTHAGYGVSFAIFLLLSLTSYLAWRSLMTKQKPHSPIVATFIFTMIIFLFVILKATGIASGTMAFILLFFAALPFVNALFDFLSWYVTRWFLEIAERLIPSKASYMQLLKGLVIDVLWAGICLILLTISIFSILRGYDHIFPDHAVNWREQLQLLQSGSGASTILLIGMLATTFIPTAIHLFAGMAGVMIAFAPRAERAIQLLKDENISKSHKQELAKILAQFRHLNYTVPVIAAILILSIPSVILYSITPIAHAVASFFLSAL